MKARTSHAHPDTNKGKLARLAAVQVVYRVYVQACIDQMVVAKRHHVSPKEYREFFARSSNLSSQLAKCAQMQAVNVVTTWAKTLYLRLKPRIYEQDYSPEFRSQLRITGKCCLTKATKTGKIEITEEALALWWGWVWDVEVAGAPPVVADDLPMWLSEMCIEFGEAKKASGLCGWWARVSCLDNGRRIIVPLAATPYLTDPSTLAKSVLVGQRAGQWFFQFTDRTPDTVFPETPLKVGVDIGLNVLASTSDGRLEDCRTKPKFDRLYKKVRRARGNRQRQGLPKDSPRVSRMEQRLSGMIKTATGTAARRLVEAYPGATFVMEDLDLRGCRGSKRFAYRALQQSLATKAPTIKVNPAHTSQTCPSCGYVSRNNRHGTRFHCRSCGLISHADVVGGKNLLRRSEDKQIRVGDHYRAIGATLRERYRRSRDSSAKRRGVKPRRVPTVVPDAYCADVAHSVEGRLDEADSVRFIPLC